MARLIKVCQKIAAWLDSVRGNEEGQTFIEYVLVIVVIVLALLAVYQLSTVESSISDTLSDIVDKIKPAPAT